MREGRSFILPASGARGVGDHAKQGGGVDAVACQFLFGTVGGGAFYPSATLRVVPLPICDGEDFR